MASVDKRPNGTWRARWREYPGGPQRTRSFSHKRDADRFLVKVQHEVLSGRYVAPEAGRVTVATYYATWMARMKPTWRLGTVRSVTSKMDRHLMPALGERPLSSIRRADLEAMYAALKLSPSSVAAVATHVSQRHGGPQRWQPALRAFATTRSATLLQARCCRAG
jgi:hypothetical protein